MSSALGAEFNGVIRLNTPELDPSQGVGVLPDRPIAPSQGINRTCENVEVNSFVVSGRGGIPENPTQTLSPQRPWQDVRRLEPGGHLGRSAALPDAPVVEAQGWRVDESGNVSLVSATTSWNPGSLTLPSFGVNECHIPVSTH